jgi:hypothetical protein
MVAAFSLAGGVFDAEPEQAQGNPQQPTNPPVTHQPPPSLGDLGFPTAQTQGNAQEQARLDRRSHMLKIHQRLGLITAFPLLATVITGTVAGGRSTNSTTRDLHAGLSRERTDVPPPLAELQSRLQHGCYGKECNHIPIEEARRRLAFLSNHSCNPNIGLQGQIVFVALRDIAGGGTHARLGRDRRLRLRHKV